MSNELLLLLSVLIIYGSVVVLYSIFDADGLYAFTVIATIAANIEALIMIKAFGLDQTLGNVMFASTFLITDILSELKGKKAANRCVNIGIATSVMFIIISQLWMLYTPSTEDFVMPAIKTIFSNTPRMMLAGLLTNVIAQRFDVWAYHKWWDLTTKKTGNERGFLWLRNNGSTLASQLLNTVIFTLTAFWGIHSTQVLIEIMIASYIIFIFTSLADTPYIYLARRIDDKKKRIAKQA